MKHEYWKEAKARATGRLDNAMDFFAPMFEVPQQQQQHAVTSSGSISGSRSSGSGGAGSPVQNIAPPPYTKN
jgi:hypothetical protein